MKIIVFLGNRKNDLLKVEVKNEFIIKLFTQNLIFYSLYPKILTKIHLFQNLKFEK